MPIMNLLFTSEKVDIPEASSKLEFNYWYGKFLGWIQPIVEEDKLYALLLVCLFIVGAIIIKNGGRYFALFFMVIFRNRTIRDIRQKVYSKILGLPLSYFSDETNGDIMSRMSNDVKEIEISLMAALEALFLKPFNILIMLVFLVFMSPGLTLFIALFLPISIGIVALIGRTIRKKSRKNQEETGRLLSLLDETLAGIRIIKGFNAETFFKKRYADQNETTNKLNISVNQRTDLASPISESLGIAVAALLLWYGGKMVFDHKILPEIFIGYFAIFSQIIPPAKNLSQAFYTVQKGTAAIERIEEIIHQDNVIHEKENAIELKEFNDSISFNNVTFDYGGDTVLSNLSFEINRGETVALVGPSGAGKSTIANLLPRFYDVNSGTITIDGKDLRDYSIYSLRDKMGIVTQDAILFNDSAYNNIAFAQNGSDDKAVKDAAKAAYAEEFIVGLDEGYDTNIGERGNKLSGGQKQRMSIARALMRDPEILILDEATSALDTASEKWVQSALENLMKNRTSIVIAHRLSTVRNADKIIVLDKGQIVEQGSHEELIAKKGLYYDLTKTQELH
jgi:subfamily B ATP-binding cassette protein MsbA